MQGPDLEALGLDPKFKFGVDVVVTFLMQEHSVAVLLVPLEQGLEDFVVFTPGHGLGLAGVPVSPQAPVLKCADHLRPRSASRVAERKPAAGAPAPLLVLVVGGGGGSHRVRHTAAFSRCHYETRQTGESLEKTFVSVNNSSEFGSAEQANVAEITEPTSAICLFPGGSVQT